MTFLIISGELDIKKRVDYRYTIQTNGSILYCLDRLFFVMGRPFRKANQAFGTVFVGIKHLCSPLSISYALAMVHLKRERIHARNTTKLCSSLGKRCSFSLRVLSGIFVQKNNLRRHLQKQQIGSNKAFCDSLERLSWKMYNEYRSSSSINLLLSVSIASSKINS